MNKNRDYLVFLLLIFGFDTVLSILVIILILLRSLIRKKDNKIYKTNDIRILLVPMLILSVWLYGLILGFINHNQTTYIIQNFAGMSFYILFWLLPDNSPLILNELYNAAKFQIVLSFVIYFSFLINIPGSMIFYKILPFLTTGSSTGQTRVFYITQVSIFFLFMVQYHHFLFKKDGLFKKELLWFILSTIVIIFITASKGFILAFCSFIVISTILVRKKINITKYIYILFIFILLTVVVVLGGYFNIFTDIFSKTDIANEVRYSQIVFMMDDLTIWGKGLGATIPGIIRNEEKPYGMEVIYLNIFHKFGVFAILIIISYIITLYLIIKKIKIFGSFDFLFGLFGLMAFLFLSFGNPDLFASITVVSHVYCLKILKDVNIKRSYLLK
jgi:hypothetical protein